VPFWIYPEGGWDMKRFIVIITSLLIIFVFVALNYLIWDRESLVALSESNQSSIDTLTRLNMTLNQEKNRLEQQIEELNKQIEELNEKIKNIESDVRDKQLISDEKTRFIQTLKSHIDLTPLKKTMLNWVNSLSEKNYTEAYLEGGTDCSFWGNYWTMRIFSDYFEQNVDKMQVAVDEETGLAKIEVVPIKTPDWEMSVYIHVNVTLADDGIEDYLKQGANVLHLTCTYDERLEQWMITSVFSEEVTIQE
jgi:cell division protein FtsB